jgi:hypothetical protein
MGEVLNVVCTGFSTLTPHLHEKVKIGQIFAVRPILLGSLTDF